jgi:dTDP-4-dehydrorhamnose 3,5-epimerase
VQKSESAFKKEEKQADWAKGLPYYFCLSMHVEALALEGLQLLTPRRFTDERGYFEELYNEGVFKVGGIRTDFVQDNLSLSRKGVVRGMHFQHAPSAQAKLVRVLKGRVMDVVVDIRPKSATFGQHLAIELSAESGQLLLVPEGFAHGFEALEETLFVYKCSALYNKTAEGGLRYDCPDLAIPWQTSNPIVSEKDLTLPNLRELDLNLLN